MSMEHAGIGLDISDSTIELVSLEKKGRGFIVKAKGRVALTPGIVESGEIKEAERLGQALQTVFDQAGIPMRAQGISFGIPESHVYIHIFSLPADERKNIENLLTKQLPKVLPLAKKDIHFSFQIYQRGGDTIMVRALTTSKKYLASWQIFFKDLGIKVNRFESEQIALARDLFDGRPKNPVAIVDIGSRTTHVGVFDKTGIVRSQTLHIAGSSFTQALARARGTDPIQAEQQKMQMAISDEPALTVVAENLGQTLLRIIKESVSRQNIAISDMVLVGGACGQKGLVELFSQTLGIPVRLGVSLTVQQKDLGQIFLEAAGLALPAGDDPSLALLDQDTLALYDPRMAVQRKSNIQSPAKKEPISPLKPVESSAEKKNRTIGLVVLIMVCIIGIFFVGFMQRYGKTKQIEERREQTARLEELLNRIPKIEEQPAVLPANPNLPVLEPIDSDAGASTSSVSATTATVRTQ